MAVLTMMTMWCMQACVFPHDTHQIMLLSRFSVFGRKKAKYAINSIILRFVATKVHMILGSL